MSLYARGSILELYRGANCSQGLEEKGRGGWEKAVAQVGRGKS